MSNFKGFDYDQFIFNSFFFSLANDFFPVLFLPNWIHRELAKMYTNVHKCKQLILVILRWIGIESKNHFKINKSFCRKKKCNSNRASKRINEKQIMNRLKKKKQLKKFGLKDSRFVCIELICGLQVCSDNTINVFFGSVVIHKICLSLACFP